MNDENNTENNETKTSGSTVPPGRVFAESANVYDDEARIAFEYFKKAAEKIIAEEDRVNEQIEESKNRRIECAQRQKKAIIIGSAIALIALATLLLPFPPSALGAIAAITAITVVSVSTWSVLSFLKAKKGIAEEAETTDRLNREFSEVKRDYSIKKLGVMYVPIATAIPFEDRSLVLDDTGTVAKTRFSLHRMNAQDEFVKTLDQIKRNRDELPIVESGKETEEVQTKQLSDSFESVRLHDYVGNLDRNLRSASYMLGDLQETSVELPVVDPDGGFSKFLEEHCADDIGSNPVMNVFGDRTYEKELKEFEELNRVRKSVAEENASFEESLKDFMVGVSDYVQLMSRAKLTSVGKIVDFSNGMLLNTFKSSYNHYSTLMESAEIKRIQEEDFDYGTDGSEYKPLQFSPTSRVRFDAVSGNWVADDGSRISSPFGIHQIQEEIIAPLVQNLLKETRTERLKIYNGIMDQKRDYLNQWHRDTDDFYGRGRAESQDIVNQMQGILAEFNTAVSQYKAFEETEKEMRGLGDGDLESIEIKSSASGTAFSIKYCEEQQRQIQQTRDEFNDYVERLKEDIDRRATVFSYTKDYDASLRDGHAKEVAMSLLGAETLDERQKVLLGANAFIASNAHLPPEPAVDESVYGTLGVSLNEMAEEAISGLAAETVDPPEATTTSETTAPSEESRTEGE